MKADYFKTRRATFNLTVHIVLVTKYRRKVFQKAHLEFLRVAFQNIAEKWNGSIVELNGESDHVHILLTYPPHKLLSGLIANLKSTSCKLMWDNYPDHLKKIYGQDKRVLWTGAYFVASCGGVTIDQLKKYVENQDSPKYYLCFAVLYWSVFHLRGETESLQTDISGNEYSVSCSQEALSMVKSLISKGLTVPHRCEKRYVRDNQSKIPFNQRQNLLVPVSAAFTPKRLR